MKNRFLAFAALVIFGSIGLFAQGIITGGVTGTVADPTGAVLPGATATILNGATNYKATATAGSDGSFSFKDVPVGKYTLTITAAGFEKFTVDNIYIASGRAVSVGTEKLVTGNASTTVEVSAAPNLLETTQAQVTTTFNSEQVADLPLAGGFDEVALLIPGVVATHADNFSNSNGPGFSVNGERGRANNFELDGQSNNDNSVAGPQVFFGNEEAIAQVQVITNNFAAQYGRNAGSVINYITKSGTNSIHGSAIYKFAGDFTSSHDTGVSKGPQFGFCAPGQISTTDNPCELTSVPRFVSNWYGGTIGAPIIKDKLFAFGSTYFQRFTEFGALVSSGTSLYPTPAGLATLAMDFPNSPGVAILQQLSPYAVSVGNPRQTGLAVNETVAGVSIPFAQFGRQIPTIVTDQEDLGRIDWQATPKDRIYVRYFYQKNPTFPGDSVANGGFYDVSDIVHSVGADETHTFGPNWVDQLRYSFQQSTLAFNPGGFPTCTISSFTSCPSSVTINGTLDSGNQVSGIGIPDNFPQGRIVKVGQLQDNATWTIGKHTVLFGGEFDYTNSPNVFLPASAGVYTFDNISDFVAGTCAPSACSLTLALGNPTSPFQEKDVALYFQDDWKASHNLTLNLGMRWEFFQQAVDLLHRESLAQQTGPNPLWDPTLPLSQTTFPNIPDYYRNFEPRLGFAYNPDFNKKLVLRGGYAINVDPAFYNINLNVATSAPVVTYGTVDCSGTVTCLPTGGATLATTKNQESKYVPTGGNPGLDNVTTVSPNFRNPLGQTYSLGFQYQIGSAAVVEARYVGNHTSRQFQSLNANPNLANVAAAFPNIVSPSSLCTAANSQLGGADVGQLNCGHTNVSEIANSAFSQYHSIQTSLTARNFHGAVATFQYTHSKNIDNASEVYSTGGGGNTVAFAQNPLNTDLGERAASGIDFPNTAAVSLVYNLPTFHNGKHFLERLTNGWQTDTIWIFNSGQPYTDYETLQSSSPCVNGGGASNPEVCPNTQTSGNLGAANPGDPRTYNSYSDINFNASFLGLDTSRPILSNPKAPIGTLGIYTDTTISMNADGSGNYTAPTLVDYTSGATITPSQVHFIANNQLAANLIGNPYPGTGRNTLRGDTYNNVDFSVQKNTKLTERITLRLEADAYNVLNRSYYPTAGNYEGGYSSGYFNNNLFTAAQGSLIGTGTGVRNMEFSGKILF